MYANTSTSQHDGPASDRRRTRRAKAPADLRLRLAGGLDTAVVDDISGHGVCCFTSHAIPLLSQVQLVLLLPVNGTIREVVCAGAVVRSTRRAAHSGTANRTGPGRGEHREPTAQTHGASGASPRTDAQDAGHETAIFFTEIDDDDRSALDEYVSSLHRTAAAG